MSQHQLIAQDSAGNTLPAVPCQPSATFREWATTFFLQVSHRAGAVALLATLATWGMMYAIRDFHMPLAIACGCADVGLCSALVARMLTQPKTHARREANGVAIFNLVLLVLALHLMVFARLEVIRSAASAFFTPTPVGANAE
jgi:hypothetical protein